MGNCQKGLSEDAVCHGHQSSIRVRRDRKMERRRVELLLCWGGGEDQ